LTTHATGARTTPGRVAESGPLRVRFPKCGRENVLEGVLINTAGGIVGGDGLQIEVDAGPGTTLALTTQAAEKVYRSSGPVAHVGVRLHVGRGATLAWLPQETIVFDRARLARTIEVELAADSRFVACEALLFGRTAMGERVGGGTLRDQWRVRCDGRLIFADALALDGAIDRTLARPAIAAGANAVATLLCVAPDAEERVSGLRDTLAAVGLDAGASAEGNLLVARLLGRDGLTLRRGIVAALAALSIALPRTYHL
jgi:urease accessory protein